jgi:hypothetical protein
MVRPFCLVSRLVAALGVLLAAATVDAHPRIRAVEPVVVTPDPSGVETVQPAVDADEPRSIVVESPDVGSDPGSWTAASPPDSPIPILLVALLAAVSTVAGRRRPRATAVALCLALSCFALQTAVHSVHHIGQPQDAEKCPVFSASQHAPGDLPSALAVSGPVESPTDLVSVLPARLLLDSAERPDRGRAPPALPA